MGVPRFAKMAANLDGHPKVRRAGRNGREVFLFVLRKNAELDRSGRVPLSHVEPWFLADQLMMSENDARDGLARAIKFGLLASDDCDVSIVGWDDEWAKAPLTEAERKARQRSVTAVSGHDRDNRDRPDCHASDQIRSEESRREENSCAVAGAQQPIPVVEPVEVKPKKARKSSLPADWKPNETALAKACELGVDVSHEADCFRDHHVSRATLLADWNAAFRNWLRNAKRFSRGGGSCAPRNNPTETALAGLREAQERERKATADLFGDAPHAAEASP